ncbi:putative pectinesterase/pectinesterase inhibitor 51 [Dorcoceras hygrometricum]|uniref:Putative pectinesterase/pectinesterase inhibitor 51 n=1 Tax=Dorcoceras hygrometricum TaxID=472368 RepID=A0A2Z7C3T3_9LAMI|nr:putative pectinesterase/pectinesterase inhibitor 51 [Dorcoceras hygrometricum]
MLEYSHAYVQSCLNKLNSYLEPQFYFDRSRRTQLQQPAQIRYSPASQKFNGKFLEAQIQKLKQIGITIDQKFVKMLEPSTTSRSLNKPIQSSKLVSIESPKEYELSASNLAPNGGVNRRQIGE